MNGEVGSYERNNEEALINNTDRADSYGDEMMYGN